MKRGWLHARFTVFVTVLIVPPHLSIITLSFCEKVVVGGGWLAWLYSFCHHRISSGGVDYVSHRCEETDSNLPLRERVSGSQYKRVGDKLI